MPWPTATRMLTEKDDGLKSAWEGRVWLNPPFSNRVIGKWLDKMHGHGHGIALVPARTETKYFFKSVWFAAHAVLFLKGRPHFYHANGVRADHNSGAPICLVAYGTWNADILRVCGLTGRFFYTR